MHDVRAVVTDLDGTVVDEHAEVTVATLRAAAELGERGVPLLVATARTPSRAAGFERLMAAVDVAVCCGGAAGWSPSTGSLLWRDVIDPATVEEVVADLVARDRDAAIGAYDGQRWQVTAGWAARGPRRYGPVDVLDAARIPARPVLSLAVHVADGTADVAVAPIRQRFPSLTVQVSRAAVVDFSAPGTDKGSGVRRAPELVGVDPARTIAFGDMLNDLPMLALCGAGVAVANSHPAVLRVATAVTECVHADGFARELVDREVVGAAVRAELRTPGVCSCPSPPLPRGRRR